METIALTSANNNIASDEYAEQLRQFAQNEKRYYFSCRYDSPWKTIHQANDLRIFLAKLDLKLAFCSLNCDVKSCELLPLGFGEHESNLECDSHYLIKGNDIEITNPNEQDCPALNKIANNIPMNGCISISEMQQQEIKIKVNDCEKDSLTFRMYRYGSGSLLFNSQDQEKKLIPRSVISVGYQGYTPFETYEVHGITSPILETGDNASQGQVIVLFGLGNRAENIENNSEDCIKKEVDNRINKITALGFDTVTAQTLTVFSMSHLLTSGIVETFDQNVQKICKLLEITMENIKKGISPEEISAIVAGFKGVQQAENRAQQAEQENIALKQKVSFLEKQLKDREATANSQS